MQQKIFIKQTERKNKFKYNCFDIYDENGNEIGSKECDGIELMINDDYAFSLEITDDGKIKITAQADEIETESLNHIFFIKERKE